MFLPSVIASKTILSDMTKFVVACVSVTQLIYLSEVGSVILGSKIPLNLKRIIYDILNENISYSTSYCTCSTLIVLNK